METLPVTPPVTVPGRDVGYQKEWTMNGQNSPRENILITGASGLIGSHVVRQLADRFQLFGMDVHPPEDDSTRPVHHITADLTDDESTRGALQELKRLTGGKLYSVIHLAAWYDFTGEPSPMYQELTVEGTRRLLTGMQEEGIEAGQFIFSSSLLVMQPDEHGRHISELSPTRAEWAYPESKLQAETLLRKHHGSIPLVILRIAGVYDEECHSLPISQQIARIYEKQLESYVFPGDPSHGQALVHLQDLAACFEQCIEHRDQLGSESLFLVAESDVMSYGELQEELGELIHGEEWPTIRIPKIVARAGAWVQNQFAGDDAQFIKPWMIDLADDHYAATIAHARTRLSWDPQHRLRDTLPEIIAFLKRDPARFYQVNKLPLPESIEKE